MSAVTLLPVCPPNWKRGVGNSCTNSNPVKEQRQKVQVKNKVRWKSQGFPENHSPIHHTWTLSGPSWGEEGVSKNREQGDLLFSTTTATVKPCKCYFTRHQ